MENVSFASLGETNNYLSQLEGTTESLQYLKSLKLEHGSKSKRRHVDEAFKRFTSDMWMKLSNVRHVDEALKRFTSIWIQLLRKRFHGGQGLTTTQLKQYDLFHVDHTRYVQVAEFKHLCVKLTPKNAYLCLFIGRILGQSYMHVPMALCSGSTKYMVIQ
ncbi:hypothetical protein YC2023_109414 [Brassica napus]